MGLIIQVTAIGILIVAIIALFVHHYFTHDGQLYSSDDFVKTVTTIFSSHEGIIILLILIMVGVLIG